MKVWVLEKTWAYEGSNIIGLYLDKEKALVKAKELMYDYCNRYFSENTGNDGNIRFESDDLFVDISGMEVVE